MKTMKKRSLSFYTVTLPMISKDIFHLETKPEINENVFKTPLPSYPAGNYMFRVNNRNTRTRCEICLASVCCLYC